GRGGRGGRCGRGRGRGRGGRRHGGGRGRHSRAGRRRRCRGGGGGRRGRQHGGRRGGGRRGGGAGCRGRCGGRRGGDRRRGRRRGGGRRRHGGRRGRHGRAGRRGHRRARGGGRPRRCELDAQHGRRRTLAGRVRHLVAAVGGDCQGVQAGARLERRGHVDREVAAGHHAAEPAHRAGELGEPGRGVARVHHHVAVRVHVAPFEARPQRARGVQYGPVTTDPARLRDGVDGYDVVRAVDAMQHQRRAGDGAGTAERSNFR